MKKIKRLFEQIDWENDPFGEENYLGTGFIIGDIVRCIHPQRGGELRIDKDYMVIKNSREMVTVKDIETNKVISGYFGWRFKKK